MPDLAISYLPIASLTPYPKNARTHSPEQIEQIAASIREYGWTNPILLDEHNAVIAGHGRLLAASSLGWDQVPTIRIEDLTAAQKRALRIADNKLALNAGWSDELLRIELTELNADGFDLGLTGFSELELSALLGEGLAGDGQNGAGSLAAAFGVPPFSVLNARGGWWQERKRAWLSLGIQSELGRGGTAGHGAAVPGEGGATAIYRKGASFKYAVPGGAVMPLERAKG